MGLTTGEEKRVFYLSEEEAGCGTDRKKDFELVAGKRKVKKEKLSPALGRKAK